MNGFHELINQSTRYNYRKREMKMSELRMKGLSSVFGAQAERFGHSSSSIPL